MRAFIRFALFATCLFLVPNVAHAIGRFAVCTVTCTWDNSSTVMWSATSGGVTGASVPGVGDQVFLDGSTCVGGVTCTITVNANLSINSMDMSACTAATAGCILDFSVNNNTMTVGAVGPVGSPMILTGAGTRTLKMGNGAWTVNATTGNIWNATSTLTLTPGSSVLTLNCSTNTGVNPCSFVTGNLTSYGSITINSGKAGMIVQGSATIPTLNVTAPSDVLVNGNITVTNAFTLAGTASNPILWIANGLGASTNISVSSGTPTFSFFGLRGVTCTGGATFAATNSFDLGGNSGCNITGPTTGGGRIIGG